MKQLNLAAIMILALSTISVASAVEDLAPLKVVTINGRALLGDSESFTIYVFDEDQGAVSSCYGGCAKAWPAVTTQSSKLNLPLGITDRTDGTKQITYDGHPVYRYSGDRAPGTDLGDGIGGIWHVIPADTTLK